MLPWDGTPLGFLKDDMMINITMIQGFRYHYLDLQELGHQKVVVIMRQIRNSYPCVIDELKEYFGLVKTGTHSIRYKGRLYLLIPGAIYRRVPVPSQESIRNIFAFRDLMGCRTYLSHIRLRGEEYVSLAEYGSRVLPRDNCISMRVMKEYFEQYSISQSVRNLISCMIENGRHCKSSAGITNILMDFRALVEDTVDRVDPDCIWISSYLVDRLECRLS